MATDISNIDSKVENEGKTPQGRISADEWNRVVRAVQENQRSVKGVKYGNRLYSPDDDGNVEIPSGENGYILKFEDTELPTEIQKDDHFTVRLKVKYSYVVSGVDTPIDGVPVRLTVRTSLDGETWTVRGSLTVESNTLTDVPMTGLLPTGAMRVQLSALTAETSSIVPFTFSVNVVNLSLRAATDFHRPFTAGASSLALEYNLSGAINKTLELTFGSDVRSFSVGSASYQDTPYRCEIADTSPASLLTPGMHQLSAVLYADAQNEVCTQAVVSEYLVGGVSSPALAVNSIASMVTNWSTVHFFDWSAVLPSGVSSLDVVFMLKSADGSVTYESWPFTAREGELNSFTVPLELDTLGTGTSNVVVHIEDKTGEVLHAPVALRVINEADFAPSEGASFVLQPSLRSNSDVDRATVVNSVDGTIVSNPEDFEGFDFENDGWLDIEDGGLTTRVLSVPAGRRLTLHYNPLSSFTGGDNAGSSATFELDFMVQNVTDEDELLVGLGADHGGVWRGLGVYPLRGVLLSSKQIVEDDQSVSWAEGRRIHLTLTVQYNAYSADAFNQIPAIHLVRMYVNGVLDRELSYDTDESLTEGSTLEIGSSSADIIIYGMRGLNRALPGVDVVRDYRSSMGSVEEKLASIALNDILDDEGRISWDKCLGKYNVLGHRGRLLNWDTGNSTQRVDLEIHIAGDEERSGTLTNLENKGQGTTAMEYYYWNQQYKITEDKTVNGVTVEGTRFLDGEGKEKPFSGGYSIAAGEPLAKKLVGKINFASSMQGHKLGLTWAYTEVYKRMFAGTADYPSQFGDSPNARLAVLEKPFLFFVWDEDQHRYRFQNLMTFGAGKGDKPTFGYDKTKHMLMVEGANNDAPLALFNMPWDDENIGYNAGREFWYHGSDAESKQINFGFGHTDAEGVPDDTAALTAMRSFFNFVYLHSQHIAPYSGAKRALDSDDSVERTDSAPQLWTEDYKLWRWDSDQEKWVGAGVENAELNLNEEYRGYTGSYIDDSLSAAEKNAEFQRARLEDFKYCAGDYFNVEDALYHYCFIKLFAGTDNRAKNTYYYTDPETLKVRWMQDDLDTVLKTNNVGQNRKPYWVEEHTKNHGVNYWAAEESVLNCLLEASWDKDSSSESHNLQDTMRRMLDAMSSMEGSVMDFMEHYVLSTQHYFPAVAYNEQARQVYEAAFRQWKSSADGTYTHGTNPLSQSCGSQLWSEYQWLVDRVMFISSWCQYGEFGSSEGAPGSLSWRSYAAPSPTLLTLTPAKWMYPRVAAAGANKGPTELTAPGMNYDAPGLSPASDSKLYIRGVNYLSKLGNMDVWQHPTDASSFQFTGSRLREVTVNPSGDDAHVRWTASRVEVSAVNIKRFIMRNTPAASGELDLSRCVRLEEIDVRGSGFTSVKLPRTGSLTRLSVPAIVESLSVVGCSRLSSLEVGGVSSLRTLRLEGCSPEITVGGSSKSLQAFVTLCLSNIDEFTVKPVLQDLSLEDVRWTNFSASHLEQLLLIPTVRLTGEIVVSGEVSFELAMRVLEKFPPGCGLTVTYEQAVALSSILIGSRESGCNFGYCDEENRSYQLLLSPNNSKANDMTSSPVWNIVDNNASGSARIDDRGLLTVESLNAPGDTNKITVTCYVETPSGLKSASVDIGLFYREAAVGDYVFADGSWSDKNNPLKTVVAGCCYVGDEFVDSDGITKRIRVAVAKADIQNVEWGVFYSNTTSEGFTSLACTQGTGHDGTEFRQAFSAFFNTTIGETSDPSSTVQLITMGASSAIFTQFGNDAEWAKARLVDVYGFGKRENNEYVFPRVTYGKYYTLILILTRDRLLLDAGTDPDLFPFQLRGISGKTYMTALNEALSKANQQGSKYRQYYYPAASKCDAYEPTGLKAGEVLAEQLREGNWYLPTIAEITAWYNNRVAISEKGINGFTQVTTTTRENLLWSIQEDAFTRSVNGAGRIVFAWAWENDKKYRGSDNNSYGTDKRRYRRIRPFVQF